jgi:zinc transport system ATP-binding protein
VDDDTVIRLAGVDFSYPRQRGVALSDVDLVVDGTEWVGLLGPNGGGKTTLLRLLLGQLTPSRGRVEVLGDSPARSRHRVGYVPQHDDIDSTVPASVLDIVLLGRLTGSSWGPWYPKADRDAALAALEETGTDGLADRAWRTLSGGQRQRVLIARALSSRADLLLLDEPTTGIDIHREKELLRLLERLNERLPIVMVSHDTALVTHHMDRALWVDRSVREVEPGELDPDSLEHLFHGERS